MKAQLYGCDCYAYALLALGCVDIVMDFGLEVSLLLIVLWIFHSEMKCMAGHSQLSETLLHMGDFRKKIVWRDLLEENKFVRGNSLVRVSMRT